LYVAATRSIPLSARQARVLRSLQLTVGAGSGAMDGPFAGVSATTVRGIGIYAEWYRNQPNVSISVPIEGGLKGKAYSLNGDLYYGLGYTWMH